MNRRVSYAKLHDLSVNLPGIGMIQGQHIPLANKTIPGLEMYHTDAGLLLKTTLSEHLIPLSNVQFLTYASEDAKPVTVVRMKTS